MKIELEIRYCDEPQRPAAAWWLASNSASAWLREIASWPGSHSAVKLVR
jgi:hypothetical protein